MVDSRGFLGRDVIRFIGFAAVLYIAFVAILFLADPYGRSGFRRSIKVADMGERELLVSRALDPSFNSAIVGNSTSIPLQPESLDIMTGHRFVSLSMSGSGAAAALAVARFFSDYHANAKTIVVAMDDNWCRGPHDMGEWRPFPFWLYGGAADYVVGLLQNASFEMMRAALFAKPGANRLDGYHPYEGAFRGKEYETVDIIRDRLDRLVRPTTSSYTQPFHFGPPAALEALVREKTDITFVLVWTPRYIGSIPKPGSPAAAADAACKRQVARIADQLKNSRVVDWSGEREENFDASNFFDSIHYRRPIALAIEKDIAEALKPPRQVWLR